MFVQALEHQIVVHVHKDISYLKLVVFNHVLMDCGLVIMEFAIKFAKIVILLVVLAKDLLLKTVLRVETIPIYLKISVYQFAQLVTII